MYKKLYHLKRFEETLGMVGLVYFLILGVVAFFLVRFLLVASLEVVKPGRTSLSPPIRFQFELLEEGGTVKQ